MVGGERNTMHRMGQKVVVVVHPLHETEAGGPWYYGDIHTPYNNYLIQLFFHYVSTSLLTLFCLYSPFISRHVIIPYM